MDDSFLIGDDLLVAAQVDPVLVKNPVLPKGTWHKIGFPVDGEKQGTTDIDTPNLPALYIHGGSIVPTEAAMQYVDEEPLDELTLLICLDDHGNASGSLYEDPGEGFDYLKGAYRLTTYRATVASGNVVVTSHAEGQFPSANRSVAVRVFWRDKEVTESGKDGTTISIPIAH